ncbi:hypothetical protein [Mycoplasma struthionis]|uniref:Uncharacterized protein n=1 Tax=Mycoplasma struthionis TaxID=538220 RepID=A0A3G8LHV9_9MOLU|nr:hypothetical protein [Mycoplasma struthionis]AZG68378.1 hypothetical protein EGN60_00060 [Mycoplasma struthionis]AZG68389.1 hypothetical protein EGN60_00120 [Mycoplasma struthionis]AZG68944.1 hypothetical protein EGN60_03300 [Mycoplasma struthionis]
MNMSKKRLINWRYKLFKKYIRKNKLCLISIEMDRIFYPHIHYYFWTPYVLEDSKFIFRKLTKEKQMQKYINYNLDLTAEQKQDLIDIMNMEKEEALFEEKNSDNNENKNNNVSISPTQTITSEIKVKKEKAKIEDKKPVEDLNSILFSEPEIPNKE